MTDEKHERRMAPRWITRERTNEFWDLRSPWAIGPLLLSLALLDYVHWQRFLSRIRVAVRAIVKRNFLWSSCRAFHSSEKGQSAALSPRGAGCCLYFFGFDLLARIRSDRISRSVTSGVFSSELSSTTQLNPSGEGCLLHDDRAEPKIIV